MPDALAILAFAAALGCGLTAGVLFGFSSFIMPALGRLPAPQGIAAMQSINVKAINPLFMTALFGSAVACLVLAVAALTQLGESWAPFALGAAAAYLPGAVALTIGYHVPRNNELARLNPSSSEAAAYWSRYLSEWTRGNHVRSAAGCLASALLIGALIA